MLGRRSNYKEFYYEEIIEKGNLSEITDFLDLDSPQITINLNTKQYTFLKYGRVENLSEIKNLYEKHPAKLA